MALLFAACSKDDSTAGDKIPRSQLDARVNGTMFYPTETQAYLSGDVLTIIGVRNLGTGRESAISLQLKHYNGPKSYGVDTATQASYTDLGVVYTADSGAVVITEISSTKYAGSFAFRAVGQAGTVRVTSGVIDIYK